MKYRHRVLALLTTLSLLTYIDRVCISVAGPRIQNELHLGPQEWGLVTGGFAIAYALFELPGGYLADRFGARAMLTRVVLWWSAFTTLTGCVSRLWPMVIVRFLFGAGEAGAYPTVCTSVFRWFPASERGRAFGFVFQAAQLGGAVAPLMIVPLQVRFGWRASFFVFGIFGVFWALGWWRWYRNSPAQMTRIGSRELAEIGSQPIEPPLDFPWRALAANKSVWAIMGATCAYCYPYYFFVFWLPTYMMRERGFTELGTTLSALPFVVGAMGNVCGGYVRDAAVGRWGPAWGPRVVGIAGLLVAALAALAALSSVSKYAALAWLALCYGGITFQQPTVFAVCVDIGKRYAGAVAGCMNTAGSVGGLGSSFLIGYLVQRTGSYHAVLVSMTGALVLGAGLWLRTDATETLGTGQGR